MFKFFFGFTLAVVLLIWICFGVMSVKMFNEGQKIYHDINTHGVKSVVERVWNGPDSIQKAR